MVHFLKDASNYTMGYVERERVFQSGDWIYVDKYASLLKEPYSWQTSEDVFLVKRIGREVTLYTAQDILKLQPSRESVNRIQRVLGLLHLSDEHFPVTQVFANVNISEVMKQHSGRDVMGFPNAL